MSIEKDVERMYRDDAERKKNTAKKKKNKKHIGLLIFIIILIIIAILIMRYLGLGFGGGKGSGGSSANSTASSADSSKVTSSTTETKEFVNIKISGSTYIYNKTETTVDEFLNTVKYMKENVVVCIEDDNATENAVTTLKNALDKAKRSYTVKSTSSSVAENSSDSTAESTVI